MVVCTKCSVENPDEARFCEGCGESLTKNCPRCAVSVPPKAKFCNKCAMPLDGSTVCPHCSAIVAKDSKFCTACGKDKSGKAVCNACGEVAIDSSSAFCHNCGSAYKVSPATNVRLAQNINTYTSSSAKPRENVAKSNSIVQLIVAWVVTGLLAIMFAFSFLPVIRYEMEIPLSAFVDDESQLAGIGIIKVKGNVSAIDVIAATFNMINAQSAKEMEKEFNDYLTSNADVGIGSSMGTVKAEVARLINNFGILKLVVTSDAVSTMPSLVIQLIIWAIFALCLMGTLLGFFIASLCGSILLTINPNYKPKNINALALSLGFGLATVLGLVGMNGFGLGLMKGLGKMSGFGGGLVAIMLVSALGLIGLATMKYLFKQATVNIKQLVAQGVSVVLVLFMVGFVANGGISVSYNAENASFKGEIGTGFIIGGIDLTKSDDELSMYYHENQNDKLAEYYKQFEASADGYSKKEGNIMVAIALNPNFLYSFDSTSEFKAFGIAAGIIDIFASLLAAVGLSGIAFFALKDIGNAKSKKRNTFNILAVVGIAALLTTGIITVVSCNMILKEFALKTASYAIGGASVTGMVFAIGHMVSYYILAPKKAKKEQAQIENTVN